MTGAACVLAAAFWSSVAHGSATDGITWVSLTGANASSNWEGSAYGNGRFVGVANVGTVLVVQATLPTTTTSTTTTAASLLAIGVFKRRPRREA